MMTRSIPIGEAKILARLLAAPGRQMRAANFPTNDVDDAFRAKRVRLVPGHDDAVVELTEQGERELSLSGYAEQWRAERERAKTALDQARACPVDSIPQIESCVAPSWSRHGLECGRQAKTHDESGRPLCTYHASRRRRQAAERKVS